MTKLFLIESNRSVGWAELKTPDERRTLAPKRTRLPPDWTESSGIDIVTMPSPHRGRAGNNR
jgi:hypothetical protein